MNRVSMFNLGEDLEAPFPASSSSREAPDVSEQPHMIVDGRRLPTSLAAEGQDQDQDHDQIQGHNQGQEPPPSESQNPPGNNPPNPLSGSMFWGGNLGADRDEEGFRSNNNGNSGNNNSGRGSGFGSFSTILQTLNQSQELSGFFKALERYVPFMLIAAAKIFFDHSQGIFVFTALAMTFFHANSVIQREVARKSRRSVHPILAVLLNVSACIVFIRYIFGEDNLLYLTVFVKTGKVETVTELLWIVAINDFTLKFVSVVLKILILLLPANCLRHRKRGNVFLLIEMTNQLHRSLVPIQVWLTYLLDGGDLGGSSERKVMSKMFGVILTAIYMIIKGKLILKDVLAWKMAASRLWHSTLQRYGVIPSADETKASGDICPICHDQLKEPTRLHCKHIFCDECLALWFDRERTCPMCRAQVAEDPAWKDGATSQFIQLF